MPQSASSSTSDSTEAAGGARSAEQKGGAEFESWGRYPKYPGNIVPLQWQQDFPAKLDGLHNGALPVGMGRSYGDSCLLNGGNLLLTTSMNRLLSFDPETGLLTAEAGITLAQILDFAVPRGFFLPVTPGTKYVTLGGAIANDIHGKNHHVAGTFGSHVTQFELVRSDGSHRRCSQTENPDWFAATIGGLGLTGLIPWAQVRLRPIVSRMIDYEGIQFHGIDEFLDLTQQSQSVEYTVSWIDCASTGKNFARGVFMQGDHSRIPGELKPSPEPKLVFPFDAPGFALNHATVSLFNTAFFHKQMKPRVQALQDYEPFFYPLDKVLHWNRLYGKSGLLQFQYAIPWESAREGTIAILREVAESGLASFLAVLKAFGDVPSPGLMSFPQPGITLALDFPIKADVTFPLFERLADMTRDFGGRLYPAKDAAMTASQFQTFYPQWEQLARFRDPMLTSSFWERVTGDRPGQ
ncbi:FAD-binding oxidoreductase [Granulicella tundricola]|uniref:FAD linked oxidase domain protein n=1 Tax=Granulicella tundricola (strain ATCC BAA-1859 / DSM 23138 / MP5ACTX9) TaxID=1198114 RepID=E8X3A1_GRATM|nr:FAD-binding oxidoreductase [Granulicella tundricola]ADW70402.1 FAD linked oxidase domain protein [Granulicella tundricola MP5ACTX9]